MSSQVASRRTVRGWGLVEMLVVILIIAVLAALTLPRLLGGHDPKTGKKIVAPKERAQQVVGVEYTQQINQAILMYKTDHEEQNPPTLADLKTYGVTSDMILDPVTHQPLAYDPHTGRVGNSNGVYSNGGGANLPQIGK